MSNQTLSNNPITAGVAKLLAEYNLNFQVKYIPSRYADDAQFRYAVTLERHGLPIFGFPFNMGIGHSPNYKYFARKTIDYVETLSRELTTGKVYPCNKNSKEIRPSDVDLLYALYSDAIAAYGKEFDEFCFDFAYDNDSIKCLKIYESCRRAVLLFEKLGISLDTLEDVLGDY